MRVAVIGLGITKFGEHWNKGLRELAVDSGIMAIEDAGIEGKDLDALYIGNMSAGRFVGQEHIGALIADQIGVDIPSTHVEAACASGGLALRQAVLSVMSGQHDIVLAGGVEKMVDASAEKSTATLMGAADEEWEAFHGFTFPGIYALIARKHMHDFGTTREQLAAVSVKNHKNAILNPIAQFPFEVSTEKVVNSPMVADPLRLLDCSPITDGAASVIVCREDIAKKYTDNPVYIVASAHASDTLALHDRRSITTLDATVKAAKIAYKMAGITAKDIDVAEVHDCFTIAELLAIEDLGFVEKGMSGKFVEEGNTEIGGTIPINTSGGLKACGHPVGATGIKQVIEIANQLRGTAGKRSVECEYGLTHNVGGSGATCIIHILTR